MDIRQTPWMQAWITAVLCLFIASGCGMLRSEFFRGETAHLLEKGNRHYRSGEFKEAEALYQEAIRLDPGCAPGHAALGNIAYVRGEFQAATACYKRAMKLDPELEKPLSPLVLDALRMKERRELEACGADLPQVLALLSSGREGEVETLLSKGVSVVMLARHRSSLSPRNQERLLGLALERALSGSVPGRCALLYGHLLAAAERRAFLAARLLESAAEQAEGEDRQEAYMALGALSIRMGRENEAAWAYGAALRAGCPRDEVMPLLANLYGMPADAVAPTDEEETEGPASAEDAPPSVVSRGNLSGSIQPPAEARSGSPVSTSRAKGPGANRAVVVRPAPLQTNLPSDRKGAKP